jgi:MFS family permease
MRNPPFRRLIGGFSANQGGFWLSHLALQGLIADLSDSDPFTNSLLFLALFVPATIVPFAAGVVADQRDRKQVMLFGYGAIAAVAYAYMAVSLAGLESIPMILALAVLLGSTFAVIGPATSALMANTVPIEDMRSAITIQSAVNNLSRIAGPIVATPIIATGRYELAFGLYATATVVALFIMRTVQPRPAALETDQLGFMTKLREGFAHARERRPARKILLTQMVLSVFGVGHTALIPAFSKEALGEPKRFALLGAATGAGALLGALLNGYDRRNATLGRGALYLSAYGVCLVGFALSGSLLVAIAAQMVVGVFYFLCATQLQTLIQEIVDDSKRGRVMALYQVSWGGVVWIGTLLLGTIAGPLGVDVRVVLVGTAAVCVAFGLGMAVVGRHEPDADHYLRPDGSPTGAAAPA